MLHQQKKNYLKHATFFLYELSVIFSLPSLFLGYSMWRRAIEDEFSLELKALDIEDCYA